jgi:hypothetical protein
MEAQSKKESERNRIWEYGLDLYGSGKRPMAGSCEHSNYCSDPTSILISCTISEPGSSISIVSGYRPDDRGSIPGRVKEDFSCSLCVQTGSGAHPASCTMGNGGPFPGGKARPRRDADHSPHLVPRSRMSRSYTSSPPKRLRGVQWDNFSF